MSVSDSGTRLEHLEAMRDALAYAIDDCESSRDLPSLVKQLREVLEEMEAMKPADTESAVERIKRERANR